MGPKTGDDSVLIRGVEVGHQNRLLNPRRKGSLVDLPAGSKGRQEKSVLASTLLLRGRARTGQSRWSSAEGDGRALTTKAHKPSGDPLGLDSRLGTGCRETV